jgi:hypothetical protein
MKIANVTIIALAALAAIATFAPAAEVIYMVGRSSFDPTACVTSEEITGLAKSYFPEARIDAEYSKTDPKVFETHAYLGAWHAFAEFRDGCLVAAALAK